jgi:hypothetical protein
MGYRIFDQGPTIQDRWNHFQSRELHGYIGTGARAPHDNDRIDAGMEGDIVQAMIPARHRDQKSIPDLVALFAQFQGHLFHFIGSPGFGKPHTGVATDKE